MLPLIHLAFARCQRMCLSRSDDGKMLAPHLGQRQARSVTPVSWSLISVMASIYHHPLALFQFLDARSKSKTDKLQHRILIIDALAPRKVHEIF